MLHQLAQPLLEPLRVVVSAELAGGFLELVELGWWLNDAAVQLLRDLDGEKLAGADRLIFSGTGERALSDMTLTKVLRDVQGMGKD